MAVINFEDLINEGSGMKGAPQGVITEMRNFQTQDSEALKQSQELYQKALANRKKIEQLLKKASEVCDKARDEVLKLTDYQEFEDDLMKVQHIRRQGNIDWRRVEASHPEVRLDPFRKAPTYFWTVKMKVKND